MANKCTQEAISLQIFCNVPLTIFLLKVHCTRLSDPDRLKFRLSRVDRDISTLLHFLGPSSSFSLTSYADQNFDFKQFALGVSSCWLANAYTSFMVVFTVHNVDYEYSQDFCQTNIFTP